MKQSKLSKLENKYYYGVSRYFWHIIISFAVLTVTISIFVFLWSQIPPHKQIVKKGIVPPKKEYPKLKGVSISEIINNLPKKQEVIVKHKPKQEVIEHKEQPPIEIIDETKIDSVAIYNFENELSITKSLILPKDNSSFWEGTGKWIFPSLRDEKMYKKTKNPKYKTWKPTSYGFKKRFINYTDYQGISEYNDKTSLLSSINNLVKNIDSVNRKKIISNHILNENIKRIGLSRIQSIYTHIAPVLHKINTKFQIKFYKKMFNFIIKNPNDGISFIDYNNSILDSISKPLRHLFIDKIAREYTNNYNNNLNSLIGATNQFIPYLKKIDTSRQVTALKVFYNLYRKNNHQLDNEIKNIDQNYRNSVRQIKEEYELNLQKAANDFQKNKSKKDKYKWLSLKAIGYGFIAVLVITLVLLILSMIRNVNRLSESILENNKLLNNIQSKKENS